MPRYTPYQEELLAHIIKNEGGYQNHAEDAKGNTNSRGELVGTNYGISAPTYEKFLGRPPTEQDMRNITPDVAKSIYAQDYIAPVEKRYGVPAGHPVYDMVVDMNVMTSPKGVSAILQRAAGAKVDGKIGPKSRKKIAEAMAKDPVAFQHRLVEERKAYYEGLMKSNPDLEKYRNGWFKRAERFRPK